MWCDGEDIPVLAYRVREPESLEQFGARLAQTWQETHPGVFETSLRERVSLGSVLSKTGQILSKVPGDATTKTAGAALQALSQPDQTTETDDVPDIAGDILSLIEQTRAHYAADHCVLIIDQFDRAQIDEEVYQDIARTLRSVATALSDSGSVCVGAQERFYDRTQNFVTEIELEEFDVNTVGSYLTASGFEAKYASDVYEIAAGNPYFTTRLLQIALQRDDIHAALADHPDIQQERNELLETRLLESLDESYRSLLRESCALPELRPDIVADVVDRPREDVEQSFRDLRQQTILKRLGYDQGIPVYHLHQLQQAYLKERRSDDELLIQHRKAAAYHLTELVENLVSGVDELVSEDGRRKLQNFAASGILFHYHISRPPGLDISFEDRLEAVLAELDDISADHARTVLKEYYTKFALVGTEVPDLDASQAIDSDEILSVLRGPPSNSEIVGTQALIAELNDDDRVSSLEAELLTFYHDTMTRVMILDNDGDESEAVELLTERLEALEETDADVDTPIGNVGRLLLIFIAEFYADRDDVAIDYDPDYDFWDALEETYGLSRADWELVKASLVELIDTVSDSERLFELFEQLGSKSQSDSQAELQDPSAISRFGLQGGLAKALFNPFVGFSEVFANLSTGESIVAFRTEWHTHIESFEQEGHECLGALYRDIDTVILEPLVDVGQSNPALELFGDFENELEVRDVDPAATLIRVLTAYRDALGENR
ncbi:hypothetical protein C5C07_19225 [Haloferax sp. Atlit-4N]|nr:hypothetical protein C5C07_19225 [Haloferax sp. Atlit-4N]